MVDSLHLLLLLSLGTLLLFQMEVGAGSYVALVTPMTLDGMVSKAFGEPRKPSREVVERQVPALFFTPVVASVNT